MILFYISIKTELQLNQNKNFSKLLSFSLLPPYSTGTGGLIFLALELQRYLLCSRAYCWIYTAARILMWTACIPWHSWPNLAGLGYATLSRLLDNLMQLPCSPSRFLESSSWQKRYNNENISIILLDVTSKSEKNNQTSKNMIMPYELFHATTWNFLVLPGSVGEAQALKLLYLDPTTPLPCFVHTLQQ